MLLITQLKKQDHTKKLKPRPKNIIKLISTALSLASFSARIQTPRSSRRPELLQRHVAPSPLR